MTDAEQVSLTGSTSRFDNCPEAPAKPASLDAVGGAPGGPLLYAFDVRGKALGAPARWDFYGIGGYGGGIIWPWRTRGSRLATQLPPLQ